MGDLLTKYSDEISSLFPLHRALLFFACLLVGISVQGDSGFSLSVLGQLSIEELFFGESPKLFTLTLWQIFLASVITIGSAWVYRVCIGKFFAWVIRGVAIKQALAESAALAQRSAGLLDVDKRLSAAEKLLEPRLGRVRRHAARGEFALGLLILLSMESARSGFETNSRLDFGMLGLAAVLVVIFAVSLHSSIVLYLRSVVPLKLRLSAYTGERVSIEIME